LILATFLDYINMQNITIKYTVLSILLLFTQITFSQLPIEPGDPPNNTDIPDFYKSKLSDIKAEIAGLKIGKSQIVANSPGGLPVFAVYYGEKDDFKSQANYNSAVGAGNPAFYAKKTEKTKPVLFFIGPVHGQEIEGIAGMINLIQVAETGRDLRGKEWPLLKKGIEQCRVIIIPCSNPDGRARCPYNSFMGLPSLTMVKYGQGTHKDGTLWRWRPSKSLHPMKGDVGLLGAYFNDNGINIMHDDFFFPMAEETKAILKIARDETPDMTVSLHSCEYPPSVIEPAYAPFFMKERVVDFANQLNGYYKNEGLPHMEEGWKLETTIDDRKFPPKQSFNLTSALHHISGTMAFTFECCHGTNNTDIGLENFPVTYEDIVDIQLGLYQEMFNYIINNRLYWE
jgi:hypothetical protein